MQVASCNHQGTNLPICLAHSTAVCAGFKTGRCSRNGPQYLPYYTGHRSIGATKDQAATLNRLLAWEGTKPAATPPAVCIATLLLSELGTSSTHVCGAATEHKCLPHGCNPYAHTHQRQPKKACPNKQLLCHLRGSSCLTKTCTHCSDASALNCGQ